MSIDPNSTKSERPFLRTRWFLWIPAAGVGTLLLIILTIFVLRSFRTDEVARRVDQIKAAGFPTSSAELNAWYPTPPEDRNAAEVLAPALATIETFRSENPDLPWIGKGKPPEPDEPVSGEFLDAVEQHLAEHRDVMNTLHAGAALTESRYPIDFTQGFNTLLPHLSRVRDAMRWILLETVLHAARNQPELATQSALASFGVTRTLEREPLLISHLVRIAGLGIACTGTRHILARLQLTDAQLTRLEAAIRDSEDPNGIRRALAGERCMGIDFFRDPQSQAGAVGAGGGFGSRLGLGVMRTIGWMENNCLFYLDIMDSLVEITDLPPMERHARTEEIDAQLGRASGFQTMIARMLLPALTRAVDKDTESTALLRAARTAVIVERYRLDTGGLPQTLDELAAWSKTPLPSDPFNGEPLRYETLETGYRIYSVGADGEDQGGRTRTGNAEPYDVVFEVPR